MTASGEKALLPAGLGDGLPPAAAQEAWAIERLIAIFAARGYARVKPPLIEFEETLLAGAGSDLGPQTFRLMDPVSQRMMGLRADMTPQVARIAATRLAREPRPLRLCYAGQVLRVKGSQLRPERQFAQVGAELIGSAAEAADAEVVLLAAQALSELGAKPLTVDLTLPTLVRSLAEGLGVAEAEIPALRDALDRKDAAATQAAAGGNAELFLKLLRLAGPADRALEELARLPLPEAPARELAAMARMVARIHAAAPYLALTFDPSEHRGFEYQTGASFTIFARGVRGELGRGGRYEARQSGAGESEGDEPQPSTGFTLFMDTVLRALPAPQVSHSVYLPEGTAEETAEALRQEGWVTLAALDPEGEPKSDPEAEARRLGCAAVLLDGTLKTLKD
ncbi:MAG: ATP phosphoribosyltransferase regulatory subunit [Rhodovibrionaceae bacterium]